MVARQLSDIVGTWQLVSASATTEAGAVIAGPFGTDPEGLLIYTAQGRMSAIISNGGRQPLSIADRVSSPAEERAGAFSTFIAYAGRYTYSEGRVVHHVELSLVPNWANTELVRLVRFEGERMVLRTPPISIGGVSEVVDLVWERVR
jgi:Lipocalin-like domain